MINVVVEFIYIENYHTVAKTKGWNEVKLHEHKKLDEFCKPEAILGSNTSSISITKIGAVTSRPEKVIGMHFMNPVPMMKLVEVIRGYKTTDEVINAVFETSKKIRKSSCGS